MKLQKKIVIVFFICIIVIILLVLIKKNYQIQGWNGFRRTTINTFSFVNDVAIESSTPPIIRIHYYLNNKIEMKDVDKVFEYTKKYIFTEKVFDDLKALHKKKYKYSFITVSIDLTDYKDDFSCIIFSASDIDGEPNYNNFNEWYIGYNNEPAKEYIID